MISDTMTGPPCDHNPRAIDRLSHFARRATAALRRLPDFVIIGGMKCGTSFLHDALQRHPDIRPASRKEVHYFDYPMNHRRGTSWYRTHFPVRSNRLSGEASPYYSYHPLVPARMAALLPRAKLIVLLRNPVDRAYFHHQHNRRFGFDTTATFEEAVALEEVRCYGECERIEHDPTYYSFHHQHSSYLDRGNYAEILTRWRQHYGERQMLTLKSEDLFSKPGSTLAKVHAFLNIRRHNHQVFHTLNAGSYAPLKKETRTRLSRYFEPHNRRLSEWLGYDTGWHDA